MLALLALLAANTALGDSLPPGNEATFLGELPVVLTAARLVQAQRDAPGAVTVLDREMISASGVRDLAELLRLVPGFQVGQLSGAWPLATYHGLADQAPRRMLVLVDGRSAYSPYFLSGIEWEQIPLDLADVERVEVFRGSNAVAYGANAFLGVVNIISRHPADAPRLRFRVTEGNDGITDRTLGTAIQTPDFTARLTLSRRQDEGLLALPDSRRSDHVDFRAELPLGARNGLEVFAGLSRSRVGVGEPNSETDLTRQRRIDLGFGQIRWRQEVDDDNHIVLSLLHQEEEGRDRYALINPGDLATLPFPVRVDVNYDSAISRNEVEFEQTIGGPQAWRLNWGLNYREDRLRSRQLLGARSPFTSRYLRLFANGEWRVAPDWLINLGASLEDPNFAKRKLAPRLSANYHMTESQTLRIALGQAYRFPTPFEKQADMRFFAESPLIAAPGLVAQTYRSAPDLQAERVSFQELGYLAELPRWRSTLDVRVFRERVSAMIERRVENHTLYLSIPSLSPFPIPIPAQTAYFDNSVSPTIYGFEAVATYRPGLRTWIQIGHSQLRINASDGDPKAEENERSAPRHSSFIFGAWELGHGLQASAAYTHTSAFGWSSGPGGRLDDSHRTDLRLAYRFALGPNLATAAVTAQSLEGPYSTFRPGQESNRRIFATFGFEF
ncbi:MAG: TonB-dependent receptor [Zoogloeaceae bacterium]|nr:TonB-dependent receptor [Zoogloeaceae bacterium]